jgi:hypothetical protein
MMARVTQIPVERRAYHPPPHPDPETSRVCPACGQRMLTPWYLRRDRSRRVIRYWVCLGCQTPQDLPEEESA